MSVANAGFQTAESGQLGVRGGSMFAGTEQHQSVEAGTLRSFAEVAIRPQICRLPENRQPQMSRETRGASSDAA